MSSLFEFTIFNILILALLTCLPLIFHANALSPEINKSISINNPHIRTEVIATGIKFPTSMAFLGSNDILVLEKNDGTVKRITNGSMLADPLLDVNRIREKYARNSCCKKHSWAHLCFLILYRIRS